VKGGERKGLYDGCGNRIGGVRKLISIFTRMSEEAGFFLRKGRLIFSLFFFLVCSLVKEVYTSDIALI